jgi:hypothetical protein
MRPFLATIRLRAAVALLAVIVGHGSFEFGALLQFTLFDWIKLPRIATRSSCSIGSRPHKAESGICGLTPTQAANRTELPAPPTTTATSCCAKNQPTPVLEPKSGCACCSKRSDGCPMGTKCRCGDPVTEGRTIAGLVFQLPGCHPYDSGHGNGLPGEPLSLRMAVLITPTAALSLSWHAAGPGPISTQFDLADGVRRGPLKPPRFGIPHIIG